MNKNLQALKEGYVKFRVNEKKFYTYNKALKYSDTLKGKVSQSFDGYNLCKRRWEYFYFEAINLTPFQPMSLAEELQRCNKYYNVYAQL